MDSSLTQLLLAAVPELLGSLAAALLVGAAARAWRRLSQRHPHQGEAPTRSGD
ncbi:hypothetical protein ACLF6K_19060 [Streptomyces xanthophaeus]|uniref:hypothetical protein n=1 Tax=Streptomyces xanthophaeus TaxID=67385 RepID=UPI003990294E